MDMDLKRAADESGTGRVRRETAEEVCPQSHRKDEKTGLETLPQCPDNYSFVIGI